MKRTELLKRLRQIAKNQGVTYDLTEGGSHTKVWLGERFVIVPRHNDQRTHRQGRPARRERRLTMPRTTTAFDSHREYTVEARRSGGWWALSIPELPGVHSQVRRLEQADEMIRDAVALAFDVAPNEVKVYGPIPIVNPDVDELLKTTRASREQLAELRARVDTLSRKLAHDMADEGIPVRDIAQALDVSFQHAAKLAKQASRAPTPHRVRDPNHSPRPK